MRKVLAGSRKLLLVAALAALTMYTVFAGHNVASATVGAAAVRTVAYTATSASSTPCSFNPATTCQSTDPTVTENVYYYGDTSACSFVWDVNWGDGQSTANLAYTDPPDGYLFLANHTYKAAGKYNISITGQVTSGNCVANPFSAQFTLAAPSPSLSGRACVFNAPNGGEPLPTFHGWVMSGHVGWAYLADPATGTWEYGANEGYASYYGGSSKTWLAEGSWANVISAFKNALPGGTGKNKNFYHSANYYKSYRCSTVANINASAALQVAESQYGEDYTIPDFDCLAQTVEVLATYGASMSEHAYLLNFKYWVPNNYYASGYMSHFGPKRKL